MAIPILNMFKANIAKYILDYVRMTSKLIMSV